MKHRVCASSSTLILIALAPLFPYRIYTLTLLLVSIICYAPGSSYLTEPNNKKDLNACLSIVIENNNNENSLTGHLVSKTITTSATT